MPETEETRKEINSAIDKRPVERQSSAAWVDTGSSPIKKKFLGVGRQSTDRFLGAGVVAERSCLQVAVFRYPDHG